MKKERMYGATFVTGPLPEYPTIQRWFIDVRTYSLIAQSALPRCIVAMARKGLFTNWIANSSDCNKWASINGIGQL
ncbi:hypothetical protein J008_06034 [Cryptococcus neoformans]|nr:hypothetical protein C365_02192 [Cryptococcus neoformans var. grubii Bt85]OXC71232.1 hypothetical protein AYX13_00099 [Cryptococcus neoformans var. grubii]OXG13448.1 hypothetical protein C367_05994 [Cryptococcus neoformans var. grubii Ze90-1]OXG20453.1 hypothetical protein C366_01986 [Cryptococcus neoformans var. grubii Tu401-1]OXM80320.1 hypothetical protein C364_01944 [Cryptococcus neoformans var. grubii Bt63]